MVLCFAAIVFFLTTGFRIESSRPLGGDVAGDRGERLSSGCAILNSSLEVDSSRVKFDRAKRQPTSNTSNALGSGLISNAQGLLLDYGCANRYVSGFLNDLSLG